MTLTAQHLGMSLKEADSYVFVPLQTEAEQWIMAWPGTEYLNEWIIALNHFIQKKIPCANMIKETIKFLF